MAEAEGKSWVFFRMNFAALVRLWRNSLMLMMLLLMVFWHVVSSSDLYGLLYTEREIFVVMSSGDEGKEKYLLIQLFYFGNYKTDFGRVRLQIMVFVTLSFCDLQSSRFVLCLPGEIFKPVEANETAMQFGLLVN